MKHKFFTKAVQDAPLLLCCSRDENLKPGAKYGPVIRDIYIFECCVDGYGSVIINGKEFPVGPGDLYILLPGDTITHTADTVKPRSGVSCSANGLSIGHLLARAGISSANPFAPREVFDEVMEQMEQMLQMEHETDPGAELRRAACLYRILGALFRKGQNTDKDTIIQKAIGIMETRYDEPLTTQILADAIGLDRSYFSMFFKAQTGLPPHKYLTRLRIQKACTLMERSGLSVALAAESVGLDPQNFSRIFKREMGVTPLEYKRAE